MSLLRRYWLPALLIVIAFVFPIADEAFDLLLIYPVIIITVYIMLALGLNIVVGFAGLLDLGFVAFYALGAYVVGWFASSQFNQVSFSLGTAAVSLTAQLVRVADDSVIWSGSARETEPVPNARSMNAVVVALSQATGRAVARLADDAAAALRRLAAAGAQTR